MWVSRSARGAAPSSASSSVRWVDSGPGSTRTSPMRWQQMTRSRPRWWTSISRCSGMGTAYLRVRGGMSTPQHRLRERDRPWMMRTYAGHSTARASHALYRSNLSKGQTGLSIAFDLPTQTGYDPDDALARGEVGKVGVPVTHLGDMRALLHEIPLAEMNTSMTINATAMWLLALYIAVAEEHGGAPEQLQGTTQNDIIKEYLSRGTYVFPPEPSL